MNPKFKTGEIVVERVHPMNKLIVIRYNNGLYYCKAQAFKKRKDIAYLERDLQVAGRSEG